MLFEEYYTYFLYTYLVLNFIPFTMISCFMNFKIQIKTIEILNIQKKFQYVPILHTIAYTILITNTHYTRLKLNYCIIKILIIQTLNVIIHSVNTIFEKIIPVYYFLILFYELNHSRESTNLHISRSARKITNNTHG